MNVKIEECKIDMVLNDLSVKKVYNKAVEKF